MQKKTTEQFIKAAKGVHGDKYDYSKVEYIDAKTKVCIICPKHGEFLQKPYAHLNGQGCPQCGRDVISYKRRKNINNFIKEARKVHGNKYDYSKVVYSGNNKTKVCIICPIHGEFLQAPVNHILLKQGCPKCARINSALKKSKTTEQFIKAAKGVHGEKYDYSKVEYINWKTKVKIICPKHGEFWQMPHSHLSGNGCPKCAIEKRNLTNDEFIQKARKIHGDKYDYSKVNYIDTYTEVEIICPIHGSFLQKPFNHLQGGGCQKCSPLYSSYENELYNFITSYIKEDEVIRNDRSILNGRELDLYFPNIKMAIEINGIKWHSEEFKDKNYHLLKLEECTKRGIKLIQIFEDEILVHKEIVYNKVKHLLGLCKDSIKISGRKTVVKEIDKTLAKTFLEKNHIQGYGGASICIGCFYNDKVIGVATFIIEGGKKWNLNRMATDYHYICQGICSKMLSYFKKNYEWSIIKSFADRRWTNDIENNIYCKLGFELSDVLNPDYRYVVGFKRIHKFNFRKQILHKKYNFPMSMTEKEMTSKLGIYKIWDCGLYKYIMEKQ